MLVSKRNLHFFFKKGENRNVSDIILRQFPGLYSTFDFEGLKRF